MGTRRARKRRWVGGGRVSTQPPVRARLVQPKPLCCAVRPICAFTPPSGVQVRPASPKYDESTFFFSNPFPSLRLTQRPASTQRRPAAAAAAATAPGGAAQADQQTLAGQRLSHPVMPAAGLGSAAQQQQQQQRPSRLGAAAAGDELERRLPGYEGASSGPSHGSQPELLQQQQQQQQQRPAGSLLKSVLKSALKGRPPSQQGGSPAMGGSQEEQQVQGRPPSQGSEGSGSKRVSFAAASAGGSSQEATPAQAQQAVPPAGPAAAAAADPTQLTAALTAPTAGETQRRRQGFVSQITPPSPGLVGGGSAGTPLSQAGFKQRRCVAGKGQQLTLLSLELHAESRWVRRHCLGAVERHDIGLHAMPCFLSAKEFKCVILCCIPWHCRRGSLLPDPRHDAVRAIVLAVADDDEEVPDGAWRPPMPACMQEG